MKKVLQLAESVRSLAKEMGGVLTASDLRVILAPKHTNGFVLRVQDLIGAGILQRFSQGVYVTPEFDWGVLSQVLAPLSYVSFEFVLARELVVGTRPDREVKAVKLGKKRVYKSNLGTVLHLGVQQNLFFGFKTIKGVNYAEKEKAWLDTLYFHQRGYRFSFDIYSDINQTKLNTQKLKKYLSFYENPKFRSFAQGLMS